MEDFNRIATAKIQIRSAESTEETGYNFTGTAVPFGDKYESWWFTESFSRECEFVGVEAAKLYWQHREVIGKVTAARSLESGLDVDAAISKTPRGVEAATLVRDGVIDRLSIGFEGLEYTTKMVDDKEQREWTKVKVFEVSLVSFPAYENAKLTEVRNNRQKEAPAMPTEENASTLTRSDLDASMIEIREELRATQTAVSLNATTRHAAPAFRSFGEFAKANLAGAPEARAFSEAYAAATEGETLRNIRAYDGGTLADTVVKDAWVSDAIRLIDKGRKVLNSFKTSPLPATGMKVEYGVLKSNTVSVAKQETEGTELSKGKVLVESDTASVETFGGWSELSFQIVERASVNLLNLTRRAQLIAYAQQTEAAVRANLATTITGNIAREHSLGMVLAPKAADWVSLIVDAAEAFEDAALPIDGIWLSKDKFKELVTLADSTDRLIFNVDGTGLNTMGTLEIDGLEAKIPGGIRARLLPGAAPATAAFYNSEAINTFENAGAPTSLEDQNITNLTRAYSVYGYLSTATEIPDAILPVQFATAGA